MKSREASRRSTLLSDDKKSGGEEVDDDDEDDDAAACGRGGQRGDPIAQNGSGRSRIQENMSTNRPHVQGIG